MPRYIFPASTVTNTTGAAASLTFYTTSTTGRREADLWTVSGSDLLERIPNGVILAAVSTGAYSAFAGPDDVDTLYVSVDGGARSAITATSLVTGQGGTYLNGTYGKVWTSPAASTTLTGTLAAWVITAVDCTAGTGARTLPAASSVTAGTAMCAKKADTSTNNLVVTRAGSDLIYGTGSGSTTKTLTLAGEAVEFVSNGVDKWTIRSTDTPSGVLATTYTSLTGIRATSRRGGRTPCWAGDSITNGTGASSSSGTSFRTMVAKTIGMDKIAGSATAINGGVGGADSANLLTRTPALLAQSPSFFHIQIGTNDAVNAVSTATYIANVKAIVALCHAANVPVSIGTVPPIGSAFASAAAITGRIRTYNLWIRLWSQQNGIPCADVFGTLVDGTTGYLSSSYDSGDHEHPNDAGHLAMALAIGPVVKAVATGTAAPDYPWLVSAPAPTGQEITGLVSNPLMAGAGGGTSVSLPTNWSDFAGVGGRISGNYTFDVAAAASSDLPYGQWGKMRLDGITNGSGGIRVMSRTLTSTAFTTGDKLLLAAYVKSSDASGTGMALKLFNGGTGAALSSVDTFGALKPGPVLYGAYTVAAGVTSIVLGLLGSVTAAQDISYYIGAANVYNLTQMGLDAEFTI